VKIAILGAGLMGSWLAKELIKEHEVALYDIDKSKAERLRLGKVLSEPSELKEFAPEMLINAVTIQNTIDAFESSEEYIPTNCIIADVASIKGEIPDYYKRHSFRFVSVHPMFGPTFADMNALKEENAVIIKESNREGAEFFKRFFERLGIRIFEYTFKEHDETMVDSLTLPFTSSMVFAACIHSKAVPGTTFKRHMDIATKLLKEDDHLLAEILFNPNSLKQLDKITSRLEFLKHIMMGRDYDEAKKFFDKLRENVK
jgi:prephenate dehydrogenase